MVPEGFTLYSGQAPQTFNYKSLTFIYINSLAGLMTFILSLFTNQNTKKSHKLEVNISIKN